MNQIPKIRPHGHWINKSKEREAMGLPQNYYTSSLEFSEKIFGAFSQLTSNQLLMIISNPQLSPRERYVAGTLLALVGDPRINTFSPEMVTLPTAKLVLGLSPEELDMIMLKYGDTGILREWIEKETPEYMLSIPAFRIGKYPVTNQEFRDFLIDTS
jgi:hypothetical protein